MTAEVAHTANHGMPDVQKYMGTAEGAKPVASGDQQVIIKLLVSNTVAGSVIGKGGQNIGQLQENSRSTIQLSRSGEFFPGTSDRVLLLSGSLHSVLTAIFLILEKVANDSTMAKQRVGSKDGGDREDEVKIALSRRLCGLLIGHQGVTVKELIEDSRATIRVQSLTELTPSDPERTITITGTRDKVLRAVALILNRLSSHEAFASYMETTLQLAKNQGVVLPPRSNASKSVMATIRASLTLYLSDEDVGAILGRKGQNLVDIQQSARVVIKISDRSSMDPTTKEREVTISGPYPNLKLAEAMVQEKLLQSRARSTARAESVHSH